jgi:hypothetical protein
MIGAERGQLAGVARADRGSHLVNEYSPSRHKFFQIPTTLTKAPTAAKEALPKVVSRIAPNLSGDNLKGALCRCQFLRKLSDRPIPRPRCMVRVTALSWMVR